MVKILNEDELKNAIKSRDDLEYEKIIANGSFAQVIQAKHLLDEQSYAIKILPIVSDDTAKYNKRELELLIKADLWKHNIVRYHCAWPFTIGDDRFVCIQMELCHLSLDAFVYKNDMGDAEIIKVKGPPRFYQHVFSQILNGLAYMHSIGWVHRDIHVSNILIANRKPTVIAEIHIKIADFGLAREIGPIIDASTPLTESPKLQKLSPGIGNELFRAPELETEYYDYKVDLFSAGIVLYFLSRYLKDKKQWLDEISELRAGNRSLKDLCHQDDHRLFTLFNSLLQEEPKKRPTAAEALKIMVQSIKKPTESTDTETREQTKQFLIKKVGDSAWSRCSTNNDTLSSLQASIEKCTSIRADSQVLEQKTVINDVEELIKITKDLDVRCMFQSAEETGKRVSIIVTENTSGMHPEEIAVPVATKHISGSYDLHSGICWYELKYHPSSTSAQYQE